jgi:hypothetical protein
MGGGKGGGRGTEGGGLLKGQGTCGNWDLGIVQVGESWAEKDWEVGGAWAVLWVLLMKTTG